MAIIAQPKSHIKLVFSILLPTVLIAVIAIYFGVIQRQPTHSNRDIKIDGIFLTQPQNINDFHLIDNHGKPFSKENLKDHWTMMFFGFTNCGYVCPTTMAALNKMYQALQKDLPANQLPQIVMVSVDPDRDSVERMNSYVSSFNPNFIGTRAEMAETIALEQQLHVAAAKMQVDGQKDQYTINHSAEIILFNPDAKLQAYLSFPHEADQMVKDYKAILAG